MVKDFKFSTTKSVRNTNLTMTTFLMIITPRMGVNGWLQFWCTCKWCLLCFFSISWILYGLFNCFALSLSTDQMSRKVVRRSSLLQRETLVLYLGGMNYLNVVKKVYLLNQKWVMRYFSGAWHQMQCQILQVCMVS